jgi:glycosyltransferase involved in cell wall biosynthesis
MKRVLHIFNSINYSGAEVMFARSVEHFEKHGYETCVLATGEQLGDYASSMKKAGVRLFHKELNSIVEHLLYVYRLVKAERIDVIHVHPENRHYYLWLSMLSKLLGVSCVRTFHNDFQSRGSVRKTAKCVIRYVARIFGCRYVSVSESVRQNELRNCRIDTKVIQNWYDTYKFDVVSSRKRLLARSTLGIQNDTFVLLTVGNCSEIKNHQCLIRSIPAIMDVFPNLLYLHAGKEETDHAERVLAKELGVESHIKFLGARTDIETLLAAADVFVMPSLYEGVGIAALESLASGIPSVFSDVPGLNTLKKYEPLASYYELDDRVTFVKKIISAKSIDKELCSTIAQKVRGDYSIERGVKEYVDVYES